MCPYFRPISSIVVDTFATLRRFDPAHLASWQYQRTSLHCNRKAFRIADRWFIGGLTLTWSLRNIDKRKTDVKSPNLCLLFLIVMPLLLLAQNRDVQSKTSRSNSIGMEFVLIQPGTFQMGSVDGDADEKPIHPVTISKPFTIGKYEVTQKQWRDIMGTNPSRYRGDNRPVESVSWDDVQDFIRKLNVKEGTTKYRLPTEAEWEFAARGGTQSHGFKFAGSSNVADVAVHSENAGGETKPVGSKRPNELDIYDMSGNVWEWCSDWKDDYGRSAERDPGGPTSGSYRVLRGGSFLDYDSNCRVAGRSSGNPNARYRADGFRCVQD